MANVYDYTAESTVVEIKNVIDKENYKACDAGTPVKKVEMLYTDIQDKPCVKFDYLYNEDGSFKTKTGGADATDYVVAVYTKYKNTDRDVPAYRTMNKKITLAAGDSMKFTTNKKDEIVFYEKFAEAFKGELEVTFTPKA